MEFARLLASKGYYVYVADLIGLNVSTSETSDIWDFGDEQDIYREFQFNQLKNDRKGALQQRISLALTQLGSSALWSVFQIKNFDYDNVRKYNALRELC